MATGRIIRFNQANGYGFIEPDDGGEDVFVHSNDVLDVSQVLRTGMRVTYTVERSSRGLRASDVEVITPTQPAPSAPAAAARPVATTAPPPSPAAATDDDGVLIDVVPTAEYEREITDALIDTIATVTAAEIVEVRRRLVKTARDRGWLE